MINIQYSYLLIVSISLFFLSISQLPNSYSLYIGENFENTYEIQKESKVTNYINNNNENYFDNDSNNLKMDNFNNKNLYSYLDNNKLTNNIIPSQESLPEKEEDNVNDINNFNLKDHAKLLKQSYKKQLNYQELDGDRSLYYNQNNNNNNDNTNSGSSSNIINDINQSFDRKKLINDQKQYVKDFSKKEGTDNNNAGYEENIPPYSGNYEENDDDFFNQKKSEVVIKKANVDENNKLVVMSKINIQNISKTGMIKVVGVINGEDFVKNIPLDELKDSAKKLTVNLR